MFTGKSLPQQKKCTRAALYTLMTFSISTLLIARQGQSVCNSPSKGSRYFNQLDGHSLTVNKAVSSKKVMILQSIMAVASAAPLAQIRQI